MHQLKVPVLIDQKRNGVAIVLRHEDKILTCQRIGCHDMNGSWQLPGGRIETEYGESAQEAAFRELVEETGINPHTINYARSVLGMGIGTTDQGCLHFTTFFLFDCLGERPVPVNREPDKHADWEWLTKEELLAKPIFNLIVEILKVLK